MSTTRAIPRSSMTAAMLCLAVALPTAVVPASAAPATVHGGEIGVQRTGADQPSDKATRSRTRISGVSKSSAVLARGAFVTDRVRVRTGDKYRQRFVTVERKNVDGGRWIRVDRGDTTDKGRFAAELRTGGVGTWKFRIRVDREDGARKAKRRGMTLTLLGALPDQVRWRSIAAGGSQTCALDVLTRLFCWGYGGDGAMGNGATGDNLIPGLVSRGGALRNRLVTTVTVGQRHACALDLDGFAYCWGKGSSGQLGDGRSRDSRTPVAVDTSGALKGERIVSISAGGDHTCAVLADGSGTCWGDGTTGALGNGTQRVEPDPVRVTANWRPNPFTVMAAGADHTCALRESKDIDCWGDGRAGQLGGGDRNSRDTPTRIVGDVGYRSVAAGANFTCGVSQFGVGRCWGDNTRGQLGRVTEPDDPTQLQPEPINSSALSADQLIEVTAGHEFACATTATKRVACWGNNRSGELGNAGMSLTAPPRFVASITPFAGIAAGKRHACGIVTTTAAVCWGSGLNGELGTNERLTWPLPLAVVTPRS